MRERVQGPNVVVKFGFGELIPRDGHCSRVVLAIENRSVPGSVQANFDAPDSSEESSHIERRRAVVGSPAAR